MFRSRHELQVLWTRAARQAFRLGGFDPAPVVLLPRVMSDKDEAALGRYLDRTTGPVRLLGRPAETQPWRDERRGRHVVSYATEAALVGFLPMLVGATEVVIPGRDLRSLAGLFYAWAHAHHHQRPVRILSRAAYAPLLDAVAGQASPPLLNPLDHALLLHAEKPAPTAPRRDNPAVWQRRERRFCREIAETLQLARVLTPGPVVFASPRLDPALVNSAIRAWPKRAITVRLSASHPASAAATAKAGQAEGVFLTRPEDDAVTIEGARILQRANALSLQHFALTEGATAALFWPCNVTALAHFFLALHHTGAAVRELCPLVLVGSAHHLPILDAVRALLPGEDAARLDQVDLRVCDEVAGWVAPERPRTRRTTSFGRTADLVGRPRSTMLIPPGPPLSHWMKGEVLPPHRLNGPPTPAQPPLPRVRLSKRAYTLLRDCELPDDIEQFVLTNYEKAPLEKFARRGAGPEAFSFLVFAAPFAALGSPLDAGLDLLARWSLRAEACFEKLNLLCRSDMLNNPDDLKSWFRGLGARGPAAEGYATMVGDALDLLEAGHVIWIERSPTGLADIIDDTAQVAYQHKRVAGKTLAPHVKKACQQLAGFERTPGAPPGHLGVAHIDVRNNRAYTGVQVDDLLRLLGDLNLETRRLDELQLLFDEVMFVFDKNVRLLRQVPYEDGAEP